MVKRGGLVFSSSTKYFDMRNYDVRYFDFFLNKNISLRNGKIVNVDDGTVYKDTSAITIKHIVIKNYNSILYVALNDGSTVYVKYTTDLSSWTEISTTSNYSHILDVFEDSSGVVWIFGASDSSKNAVIYKYDLSTVYSSSVINGAPSGGYYKDGKYYFVDFDGSGYPRIHSYTFSTNSWAIEKTFNIKTQDTWLGQTLLYENVLAVPAFSYDNLMVASYNGTSWNIELVAREQGHIKASWNKIIDSYTLDYFGVGKYIYKYWKKKKSFNLYQKDFSYIYGVVIGYGGKIYKDTTGYYSFGSSTTLSGISKCIRKNNDFSIIDSSGQFSSGEYLVIYDDDDNLVGDCLLVRIQKDESLLYKITGISPINLDLKKKITYSNSSKNDSETIDAISDLLDYCSISISGSSTTTRDHNYSDKDISSILDEITKFSKLVQYYDGNLNIIIDDGTNSNSITISESNAQTSFKFSSEPFRIKSVKLYGGFINGERITAEKISNDVVDGIEYVDYFPQITDTTSLSTIAQNIINSNGSEIKQFRVKVFKQNRIQVGKQITYSDSRKTDIDSMFGSASNYYVNENIWNVMENSQEIFCSDALMYRIDKKDTTIKSDKNESHILQIARQSINGSSPIAGGDLDLDGNAIDSSDNIIRLKNSIWILINGASETDLDTCISEISTAGGGTLILSESTITVNGTKTIPDNTTIKGGRKSIIKQTGDYNTFSSGNNCVFEGFTIDDADLTADRASIYADLVSYITVMNMKFTSSAGKKGHGVYFKEDVTNFKITNNEFHDKNYCIFLRDGEEYGVISNNYARNSNYGFYVGYTGSACEYINITGNMIYSTTRGLHFYIAKGITVTGNTFYCTGSYGVYFSSSYTQDYFVVVGNRFRGSTSGRAGSINTSTGVYANNYEG